MAFDSRLSEQTPLVATNCSTSGQIPLGARIWTRRDQTRTPRLLFAIAFCGLLASGCAATEELLDSGCTTTTECDTGEICQDGVCVASGRGGGTSGGGRGGTTNADAGTGLADTGSGGGLDAGAIVDSGTSPTPDTGSGTTPDTGTTPTPDSGAGSTDSGGTTPDTGGGGGGTCTTQMQTCELTGTDPVEISGEFYCVSLTSFDTPRCLRRCSSPQSTNGCDDGSLCWTLDDGGTTEWDMCLPSECDSWEESAEQCAGDTCVLFGDDEGLCFTAGSTPAGGSCPANPTDDSQRCQTGAFCDLPTASASAGVCRPLCEFYGANSCAAGQTCGLLTLAQGYCQPVTTTPVLGECAAGTDWCNERSRCFEFGSGADVTDYCMRYCRRGVASDCADLSDTVCNWNVFSDSVTEGLCFPPCESAADCPTGALCSMGVCSEACASDADCSTAGDVCFENVCKPAP